MNNSLLFNLKNKNVLITGGAGILGQVFCKALAEANAGLAIYDSNEEQLTKLITGLNNEYPQKIIGYICDITDKNSIDNSFKKTLDDFKNIHILHNNAASKGKNLEDFFTSFEEYKLSTWKDIMSVNIDGMFLMAQAVGKHMLHKKIKGSIIQTSSIYGVIAPDNKIYKGSSYLDMPINTPAVYTASKAAVIGLTKYLASYWGTKGIRVNSITPGGMESGQNDIFKQKYSAKVPLGRMGAPSELVGALIYLCSDASTYVTGQNLIIDGGLTCM